MEKYIFNLKVEYQNVYKIQFWALFYDAGLKKRLKNNTDTKNTILNKIV